MKTNVIYSGDCFQVMANTINFPDESVDLIYVDPPFFSNKHYEVIWGDGYELRAFEDRWKGGIENYIAWMEPKIGECYRVLKKTGSMYLHCDWHANAHLRILMDKIFGENNFRNEIIRQKTMSCKAQTSGFGSMHDTLLFYSKSNEMHYKQQFDERDEEQIKARFPEFDEQKGLRYVWDNFTQAGQGRPRKFGKKIIEPPKGKHWIWSQDKIDEGWKEGVIQIRGTMPRLKRYETEGVPVGDIWIGKKYVMHSQSKEASGYPTQKPEALLERIINSSSKLTDIVLDPMCGCGTAIVVAYRLGRRWIGIDISPTACKLMARRMKSSAGASDFELIGLPKTLDEIKKMQPFEFQNWVCEKMTARMSKVKSGDMGIDGYCLDGRGLQVKQSEGVGRNVIDNFETALKRAKKTRGVIVALSFGKGAHEEVARAKNQDGIEIELKTVEDLIGEE